MAFTCKKLLNRGLAKKLALDKYILTH